MKLLRKHTTFQIIGFTASILAWIFCSVSMGLPQWREWHFHESVKPRPSKVLIGMWRTCIYRSNNHFNNSRECYRYTYADTFIPLYIRIAQHLILFASFLGMIGTVSTIIVLWNLYIERTQKNTTCSPFCLSGILNILAGVFVSLAILYTYLSIVHKEVIVFPPSFQVSSFPDVQKAGIALATASLAVLFFIVSAHFSFFSLCTRKLGLSQTFKSNYQFISP